MKQAIVDLIIAISNLFRKPTPLELSPSDWVPKEAIAVVANSVTLDMRLLLPKLSEPPKVWIPPIPGTGSMLPNFSHEHNNILVAGINKADHTRLIDHLQVGDITVYRIMENEENSPDDFSKANVPYGYAIHRIIKIDRDNEGRYFHFKGDNNSVRDRFKVRDTNILWVSVGVIF